MPIESARLCLARELRLQRGGSQIHCQGAFLLVYGFNSNAAIGSSKKKKIRREDREKILGDQPCSHQKQAPPAAAHQPLIKRHNYYVRVPS